MDSSYSMRSLTVYPHHIKQNVCGSRAKYRDGRKDRAVKVYTVNQESVYLLISNVPAVGGAEDLRAVCDQYGMVEDFKPLDGYPTEEFTEVYLAKYDAFPSARIAKKHLDDRSFLGGTLHVCYAPEFETVQETRLKLQDRRKYIAWKTNTGKTGQSNTLSTRCNINPTSASRQQPAHQPPQQPVTYIWAGKEYTVHPQPPVVEDVTIHNKPKSSGIFVPRQLQSSLPSSLPITSPRGSYQSQESSSTANIPQAAESSYESTISSVRKRVSKITGTYSLCGMEDMLEIAPTEPILSLKCRFCQFTALNTDTLFKHETGHFRQKPVSFQAPYSCTQCSKVFKECYHLQSHMYTHDTARHFVCPFCERSFRHSSSLARHKRSHRGLTQNNKR